MSRHVYVPCTRASKFRGIVEALYDSENPCGFQVLVEGHFQQSEFPRWMGHRNGPTNRSGGVEVIVNDMLVWTVSFLGPSMLLLTTGVFVFCWAEQPRAVAHAAAAALGYSTLRMIIFFANSVRLSNVTIEDKRNDDIEERRPQTRGVRYAQSPIEDMGDMVHYQLAVNTVTTPYPIQGPRVLIC